MTPAEVNVRTLLAVAVVIGASRFFGWVLGRLGQPRVHGEVLAGILLGPSLLGVVWPGATGYLFPAGVVDGLRVLAGIGLVLFMFLIGLELDLHQLRGQGRRAVLISHASIVLPMALGSLLGLWLHPRFAPGVDRLGFVLFMGAAMAITAFPVLARVLQETGMQGTRIGVLVIACAAIDDVTAWCVLAGVVAVVQSAGPSQALLTIGLSLVFSVALLAVVRPLLRRLPQVPAWLALVVALAAAWTTESIGIHAIFGAFLAGVAMPRHREVPRQLEDALRTATLTVLLPVFFVVVGLATRIDRLDTLYLWGIVGLVVAAAVAGKWGGAMAAALVAGEGWRDAATIGVLMNTRGLTELVILSVGLELGLIGHDLFTVMVIMALVTTLMATPVLHVLQRGAPAGAPGAEEPPPAGAPAAVRPTAAP